MAKAISTVIASILMLAIVIVLGGTSYLYISGVFTGKISTAFEVIYASGDTITIRNDGTDPITSFRSVKIDNEDAIYLVTKQDDSLVGYWKMDELNNTGATDSSGKNNQGTFNGETFNDITLTNSPTWTTGKYGNALSFLTTANANMNAWTRNISASGTVTFWVKPLQTFDGAQAYGFVALGNVGGNNDELYVYWQNNVNIINCRGSDCTGNFQTSSGALTNGQWYFIAITWDGSVTRAYIDAVGKGSVSVGTISGAIGNGTTSRDQLVIGARGIGGGQNSNSSIDEVRIYNRALSQAEIQEDMNSPYPVGRTVAWYNFENDAKDRHNIVKGRYGTALSFDGTNDFINVGNGASLNPTNTITIEAWIKPFAISSDWIRIAQKCNTAGIRNSYCLIFAGLSQKIRWELFNGGTQRSVDSLNDIQLNAWSQIVGVYDGYNTKIYINGNLDNTNSYGTFMSIGISPLDLIIGSSVDDPRYFNGIIDEHKLYNRALTDQEVKASYNIGSQINAGETATIKIYNQLSKGTHTLKLCTSSMCNTAYLMVN